MRLCLRGTRYIVISVVLLQLNLGLCDHEIVASFGEEERPQANMAILRVGGYSAAAWDDSEFAQWAAKGCSGSHNEPGFCKTPGNTKNSWLVLGEREQPSDNVNCGGRVVILGHLRDAEVCETGSRK